MWLVVELVGQGGSNVPNVRMYFASIVIFLCMLSECALGVNKMPKSAWREKVVPVVML